MSEGGLLADVYSMQAARKKPLTVDFNDKRLAGGKWLNEIRRATRDRPRRGRAAARAHQVGTDGRSREVREERDVETVK